MFPGDLGGCAAETARLSREGVPVEFCGRDGKIAEIGGRPAMLDWPAWRR